MRTCAKRRRPRPRERRRRRGRPSPRRARRAARPPRRRGQASERVERELAAEHGREHQHAVALLREVGEPAGDDVADALRDGRRSSAVDFGRTPSTESRRTISPTKSGLPSVSSYSAATSWRGCDLRRRQLDVLRDLRLAEPGERQAAGHGLAGELGQHLGQRPSRNRIDVAIGGQQEDVGSSRARGRGSARAAARARRRRGDHRGRAGSVGLLSCCAGTAQSRRTGESALPRARSGGGIGQVGETLAQLGEDLGELLGAGSEMRAQRGRLVLAHVGAQGLHPGPVGGSATRLPAAADQHASPAATRARRMTSSARRLLPMPGSPTSKNRRPRPANASSRPAMSSASSAPRPTNAPRDVSTGDSAAAASSSFGSCSRIA